MLQRLALSLDFGGWRLSLASQLRAELADLKATVRALKAWADDMEARANPPRTMPLRLTLREPY
jgi:hypothetical protein